MAKEHSVSRLIGIVCAVIVVILICWPIIGTITEKADETALHGAVTNAYTVFLYAESEHASLNCDILFVFDGKVAKVKNNNIRNIEMLEEYKDVPRIELGEALTEGQYVDGTYVRQQETDFFAVSLHAGDSLAGLRKVDRIHKFEGYRFYGHLEKCDIYVPF